MISLGLITIPLLLAGIALVWPKDRTRPWLLPVAGVAHVVFALWLLVYPPEVNPGSWLGFDAVARAVLPAISLLFLVCSFYGVAYLRLRAERPNRVFVAILIGLLGLMSLALQAQHLGLLWIAVETATLGTVPLLHFNTTARAIESAGERILPLVAHDRATLGGMLIASGLTILLTSLWGYRPGERWLWWTLLLAFVPRLPMLLNLSGLTEMPVFVEPLTALTSASTTSRPSVRGR